jgi:hypothetical protein
MKRSNVQTFALFPVILVIVVGADVGDALRAEQLGQSRGDGGLAGGAVTDYA